MTPTPLFPPATPPHVLTRCSTPCGLEVRLPCRRSTTDEGAGVTVASQMMMRGSTATPEIPARQSSIHGPEEWGERAGTRWSWWDVWFCAVAVADHGADLGEMDARLASAPLAPLAGRETREARLSHLADLRDRLASAGLSPLDLAGAEITCQRRVLARARKRVWGGSIERAAVTEPMVHTPRRRLEDRARRGHWGAFPVSPQRFYPELERLVDRHVFVEEHESFSVVSEFAERVSALEAACRSTADRVALYRAAHTAFLELQDQADDSYGVIGDERDEIWKTYVRLDWRATGMAPADYWRDVTELVVWEDYGLCWQEPTRTWRGVTSAELDLVEGLLAEVEAELWHFHLDYQAREASRQRDLLKGARRRRRSI